MVVVVPQTSLRRPGSSQTRGSVMWLCGWRVVAPSPAHAPSVLCSEGSNLTPAHHYADFRFKTYAPVAFRYFRELFGIRPDDYLVRIHFGISLSFLLYLRSNPRNLPLNQGCRQSLPKRNRKELRSCSDPSKEWERAGD